jgi:LytS/YehU family sensor histidine kinase
MNRTIVFQTQSYNEVLKYTDIRSYLLTFIFILLSVTVPWIFHQFQFAGATFLPMHIFILIAGLSFGWRAGLIVGICTPLASYAINGMPSLALLPQVTIELSIYGFAAGILHERFNLRVIWSLLGAMLAGRIVLLLVMLIIHLTAGTSYSPLGPEANPLIAFWSAIKQGWPGIVTQLAVIPAAIFIANKFIKTK